jgi:hypothetical protein
MQPRLRYPLEKILGLMLAMLVRPTMTTIRITTAIIYCRPKPSLMKPLPIPTKGDYSASEAPVSARSLA